MFSDFSPSKIIGLGAAGFLSFVMRLSFRWYLEYISSVQRVNKYTICLGFIAINAIMHLFAGIQFTQYLVR